MSSIDKYVIGEARKYDPRVRVTHEGGNLVGRVDGKVVFSIADRYGYLSNSERDAIRTSFDLFEEQEKERRRVERERAENVRREALARVRNALAAAKGTLARSYADACRTVDEAARAADFSAALRDMGAYNVDAVAARAQSLSDRVNACRERLDAEYAEKKRALDAFTIDGTSTAEQYFTQEEQLKKFGARLSAGRLPAEELRAFGEELHSLKKTLGEVDALSERIRAAAGADGQFAADILRELRTAPISSEGDVAALLDRVQEGLAELKRRAYSRRAEEGEARIAALGGAMEALTKFREYVITQDYRAADHRAEVLEWADKVYSAYSGLETADYTTCSADRIAHACSQAEAAICSGASDERTAAKLKDLFEEYTAYSRDDALQRDNYRDYLAKRQELIERGAWEEEPFDACGYDAQRARLNERLYGLDTEEAVSRSRVSLIIARKAMEEMGYRLIDCNFGALDGADGAITRNTDALACEAVFARPGCEGVVVQLIASDCGLIRRLLPVRRTDGRETSAARVLEVAKTMEQRGEIEDFYGRYQKECGALALQSAVDTDTAGSEDVVRSHGAYRLTEERERAFNDAVASGSETERAAWATRLRAGQAVQSAVSEETEDVRARAAQQTADAIRRKRT